MKTDPNHAITFHVSSRPEGAYRVCTVDVSVRERVSLTAEQRKRRENFGLNHCFAPVADAAALRLSWLEYRYDDGVWVASAPDIDIGDRFSLMSKGLELLYFVAGVVLRRLRKPNCQISDAVFEDPARLVRALRKSSKAVEIEPHRVDREIYWIKSAGLDDEDVAVPQNRAPSNKSTAAPKEIGVAC